jgi:hypothetical protein
MALKILIQLMLSIMRAWWTLNPEVASYIKAEMRRAHPVRKRLVDEVERVALSDESCHLWQK